MKKILLNLTLFFLCASAGALEIDERTLLNALHSISSHDLLEYVIVMCDEKYEGRLTGTSGYHECAEWLAGEFKKWGLTPGGEDSSWFQWFDIPYTLVYPDCGLSLHMPMKNGTGIQKNYRYRAEPRKSSQRDKDDAEAPFFQHKKDDNH